jgi:type VI secretion system secreted protein Hcp
MAFDAFVYFDGKSSSGLEVKGESSDATYKAKGAFEIHSFSLDADNRATHGPLTHGSAIKGSGRGKVSLSSFNIMKKTDAASAALFRACCDGSHFDKAHVVLRKAGGKQVEYLKYDFEEVFIESFHWSGSTGGDDTPTESLSLSFGKVKVCYTPQKPDGTPLSPSKDAGWDTSRNEAT